MSAEFYCSKKKKKVALCICDNVVSIFITKGILYMSEINFVSIDGGGTNVDQLLFYAIIICTFQLLYINYYCCDYYYYIILFFQL